MPCPLSARLCFASVFSEPSSPSSSARSSFGASCFALVFSDLSSPSSFSSDTGRFDFGPVGFWIVYLGLFDPYSSIVEWRVLEVDKKWPWSFIALPDRLVPVGYPFLQLLWASPHLEDSRFPGNQVDWSLEASVDFAPNVFVAFVEEEIVID